MLHKLSLINLFPVYKLSSREMGKGRGVVGVCLGSVWRERGEGGFDLRTLDSSSTNQAAVHDKVWDVNKPVKLAGTLKIQRLPMNPLNYQ